jgi:hypothetical protein
LNGRNFVQLAQMTAGANQGPQNGLSSSARPDDRRMTASISINGQSYSDLYHRVLSYSGTFENQQWQYNPETPHGAWEFHEHLIPGSPAKPIRIWMEVGDSDVLNPNAMRDNIHDSVLTHERMAAVLAAKGHQYRFVFARNAGHADGAVSLQTLPEALEYLWQGYPIGQHIRYQNSER